MDGSTSLETRKESSISLTSPLPANSIYGFKKIGEIDL